MAGEETISAMEGKIDFLNAELATVTLKEAENKKYLALQTQLIFLFEIGNILDPFLARVMMELIRRVMRMIR